jgi:nucleotide-binding universal stress UspA family protein
MWHIVVGADGSKASHRALAWAVGQARATGATVQVVHAWTVPALGADPLAQAPGDPRTLEAQARRELGLVVDVADERGLVSPIECTVVRGEPVRALLDAAKGADLLVVGSRGLGDGDAPLGSVSHGVIGGAPCPTVIVPPEEHLETP